MHDIQFIQRLAIQMLQSLSNLMIADLKSLTFSPLSADDYVLIWFGSIISSISIMIYLRTFYLLCTRKSTMQIHETFSPQILIELKEMCSQSEFLDLGIDFEVN